MAKLGGNRHNHMELMELMELVELMICMKSVFISIRISTVIFFPKQTILEFEFFFSVFGYEV